MSIEFNCSQCQTMLRVPEAAAGKSVRCPKCSAVVTAPNGDGLQPPTPSPFSVVPPPPSAIPHGAEENPYASPVPSTVPTSSIPDMVGGPLEAGYVLSRTWEIFKIHWGLCLVAALIPGGVQQLVSMVLQVFIGVAAQIDPILAVIILFLAVLIAIPLMVWLNVGQMLFMLRVAQGEAPEIGIMFRGAPWILRMVGLWLLLSLLLNVTLWICIGIPAGVGVALGAALGEPGGGALVGVILGAVVGLIVFAYLTFAFSQAAYLMIDRNVGVMDSLRGSWQITQGNKLAIFLVYLMLMLINLGGLAACCIGVMATMPFSILALAVMYTIMARSSQTQMA